MVIIIITSVMNIITSMVIITTMITEANWNCGAPNAPVLHSKPVNPPQISFNEVYSTSQFSSMPRFHDLSVAFLLHNSIFKLELYLLFPLLYFGRFLQQQLFCAFIHSYLYLCVVVSVFVCFICSGVYLHLYFICFSPFCMLAGFRASLCSVVSPITV